MDFIVFIVEIADFTDPKGRGRERERERIADLVSCQ